MKLQNFTLIKTGFKFSHVFFLNLIDVFKDKEKTIYKLGTIRTKNYIFLSFSIFLAFQLSFTIFFEFFFFI